MRFAAIGLAGITAIESLRRIGDVSGNTLLVTGTTGGIGGVAGAAFPSLVAALRPGGCYCMYGAAPGGHVGFDAWNLIERRVVTGYSSEDLGGVALRAATSELLRLSLAPPPTTVVPWSIARYGLEPSSDPRTVLCTDLVSTRA